MTFFLQERIEDLLGPGKGHGVNQMWRCPWHEEKHASLSVNLEEGLFFCFGCRKKGNYETLCRQFGEIPDDEYKWERAKRSVEEGFSEPANLIDNFHRGSSGRTAGYGPYSESFYQRRGIDETSGELYGVSRTTDGLLAFPYFNIDGERVNGIKYRHPDGSKTAEPGSSFATPFGLHLAVGKSDVFIMEGESDTLKAHTTLHASGAGICGTSGVGVSEVQWTRIGLHLLFTRRVFLVYDNDAAGDGCADTAMRVLGSDKCIRLTPRRGKDFTEHLLAGGTIREMM